MALCCYQQFSARQIRGVLLSQGKEFHGSHINRARAILIKITDRANKNTPRVGEISFLERLELFQGTSRGGWCWNGISRDARGAAPGIFWELPVGLDGEAPSASIPGHRSRCKNWIMRKGKRRERGKQGIPVLPVLQQLAAVSCGYYHQLCFMSSSPTGIILFKIPFPE